MPQSNKEQIGRRNYMGKIGATGAAAAIAGCISGQSGGKPNQLTFGVWGGTWQDLCIKAAIDPFRNETDIKVNYNIGAETERFNKIIAQQENPPVDATQLPLEHLQRGANEGLWHELDSDLVPVYGDVPDKLKGDGWLAHHFTASSLAYNTNTFDEPPQDMSVYLDTEYKGRVALGEPTQRSPAFDLMAFSLYKTNGKTYKDIEAAFQMYEEILETMNPKFAGATEQYGKWFANDVIDIARIWAARSASWNEDGTAINYVLPPNGAMLYSAGHALPKNVPENKVEWAGKLVQHFYTPDASKEFATTMYYPTVNPVVNYPDKVKKRVPLMSDVDKLVVPDYDWLGKNREKWTERANQLIQKFN